MWSCNLSKGCDGEGVVKRPDLYIVIHHQGVKVLSICAKTFKVSCKDDMIHCRSAVKTLHIVSFASITWLILYIIIVFYWHVQTSNIRVMKIKDKANN